MEERHLVRVAKALADSTRFRIFQTIAKEGELSCSELAERFPVVQATVSHHLRVLMEAGLVDMRREGQFHFFRANREALRAYWRALCEALGCEDP